MTTREQREEQYFTARDLQEMIRVDKSTIYRMAESGRVPAVKVGRQWRFPAAEVRRWLAGETPPANGTPAVPSGPPAAATHDLAALFADLFGVMVVATDMEGRPITPVINPCGYFDAVAEAPGAVERCVDEWRTYTGDYDLEPRLRTSHLGLLCARAYIRKGNELIGMVLAGGIAPDQWPPDLETADAIADASMTTSETILSNAEEVYHLDEPARQALLRGLSRLGTHLSRLAADDAGLEQLTGSTL
jgi:excisionase family DNA binding protein